MDSEKDEGYNSPQESVDGPIYPRVIHVNSWDTAISARYRRPESGIHTQSYSLESIGNSSIITDNLWLTLPEARSRVKVEPELAGIPLINDPLSQVLPDLKKIKFKSLINDLMDLLCGKPSATFAYDEDERAFKRNVAVVVEGLTPSVLATICQPFLETGTVVVKLNNVDEHFHFQTFALRENESKVWVRLIKFVKDFLQVYQTILMLNREGIETLSGLRRFIHPFQQQIQTLWDIIDSHVFANPALLLKNLNDVMMQTEVPWICQLLQNLLVSCASAYSQYVADWIYRGDLKSKLEFHIIKNRAHVSKDRQYWTSQFAQNEEIPLFLKHLKGHIFETGKTLNLLRELCDNRLPPCLEYNTDLFLPMEISHPKILDLMNSQDAKLADELDKNSYLETGLKNAMDFRSFKYEPVDLEAVKASHLESAMRVEAERLEKIMKAREKKQNRLSQILEDMERARMERLQRAIDDIFEDKRIEEQRLEMVASQRGAELLNRLYGIVIDSMESSTCLSTSEKVDLLAGGDTEVKDLETNLEESLYDDDQKACSEAENYFTAKTEMSGSATSCVPDLPSDEIEQSEEQISSVDFNWSDRDFKTKPVMPMPLKIDMFDAPLLPPAEETTEPVDCEEYDVFQTNRFLSLSVEIPLMAQKKLVNLALLHLVIVDKQLFRHLKALQDYLLVQNGLFARFLASALIERIDKKISKGELGAKVMAFNGILDDVLLTLVDADEFKFLKRMRFDINQEASPKKTEASSGAPRKKQGILSDYEVLNSISLRYRVDWPLNIILTEEFLKKAERAFGLQMRLQRVEILLAKATLTLKCKVISAQLLELGNYRHHMLHFIRSMQTYINMVVIQPSWTELTSSLSKVNALEEIYELVVHYIKSLTSNCLLGPKAKPIMKLLDSLLVVIEAFCSKLDAFTANCDFLQGQQLKSKDYKALLQHYLVFQEILSVFSKATFTASQKGYYPKISHFVEIFNFNGYYNISVTSL